MKDYFTFLVNTDGAAFPLTKSINASGPSATDGTEWVAGWCDEVMGVFQAALFRAGLTPSGVSEAAASGNSQFIEALNLMGPGPGVITEWANALDPAVSGHRAIECNGQVVLRTSFPELDAAIYVGDANNAAVAAAGGLGYRTDATDTTPNIAGTHIKLPESRGVVPRGLDLAATIDPDGAGRFLGDLQIDAFQGHLHYSGAALSVTTAAIYGTTPNDTPGAATVVLSGTVAGATQQPITSIPKDDLTNGTPRTATETRAYNRSTKFVIWY